MGRSNASFDEGKDHTVSWKGSDGNDYSQKMQTSKLLPGVDKQKAVGKHMASQIASGLPKPVKGSMKWKASE